MTLAEHKRVWFDQKRGELNARGLKDAHIAEQMGVKRAYFSQLVNGMNISDQVIDRMTSAFGFRFVSSNDVADNQTAASVSPELSEAMRDMIAQAKRNNEVIDFLMNEVKSLREQLRIAQATPSR